MENDIRQTIAFNVRDIREKLDISPETLSERIEAIGGSVSGRYIRRVEDGANAPAADQVVWIARGLGVSIDRIYKDIPEEAVK